MPDILVRLSILLLISVLLSLLIWLGRRFVETRRQRALATELPSTLAGISNNDTSSTPIRILAFSSPDCHQCHQLQTPALQRVLEARGNAVSVVEIDAPSSPDLVQSYHVLTVPTTVVLDATGHPHAVNYGFANTQRLLEQVDEILEKIAL